MAWGDDEKRRFREGFTGSKEQDKKKKKLSYSERRALREAQMSPQELAENKKKRAEQRGYEDGGAPKKKSYFKKLKDKLKK